MITYAQNFEDVLLHRCFGKLPQGFYVDIGAYHPVIASVTKIFYEAGWSGINVEPGPGIDTLRRERPRDINLALAVTDAEGEADFWEHIDDPGTSTMLPEVADVVAEKAGERIRRRVPTLSLALLLGRYAGDRHIHFLKIDTEGTEDAIVAGGDWQTFRPEVLVVESTAPYTNRRSAAAWQKILEAAAYRIAYFDGINDFWVRKESAELLEAFAVPVNVLDAFQVYDPEIDLLNGALAQARESAADAQVALVQAQEEVMRAEQRRIEKEAALSRAKELAGLLDQQKQQVERALMVERDHLLRAEASQKATHDQLAAYQRELDVVRAANAGVERDLATTREELASLRQPLADLQKWRFRLIRKLKMDDGPRELRMVLPLARVARFALQRRTIDPDVPTPAMERIELAEVEAKKPSHHRKLKKRIKSTRKRLRRWLISATRRAVVPIAIQLARRSPKLFAKIRKDVRRHVGPGDGQPAGPKAIPPLVLEDAILTIALHDDRLLLRSERVAKRERRSS
jgi:FkbM family methyltransferase